MTALPDHILDLLEGYPDELDDAQLATLRAAAEQDPRVDEAMHAILAVDAALTGAPADTPPISDLARHRISKVATDAPKAWGSPPVAPLEARARPTSQDNVVPLFARRPVQLAIAALLLLAAGLVARSMFEADDPYGGGIKGDDDDGPALTASLILQAPDGNRLADGAARATTDPVRITARLSSAASLALLEVQGDVSAVVWPAPDAVWSAAAGPNLLQPPGASPDYRPAAAGPATYVLVARPAPLRIPGRRITEADLLAANEGAAVLSRFTVAWSAPAGDPPDAPQDDPSPSPADVPQDDPSPDEPDDPAPEAP